MEPSISTEDAHVACQFNSDCTIILIGTSNFVQIQLYDLGLIFLMIHLNQTRGLTTLITVARKRGTFLSFLYFYFISIV